VADRRRADRGRESVRRSGSDLWAGPDGAASSAASPIRPGRVKHFPRDRPSPAGRELATNLIAKGVLALLRQPESLAWLRAHPDAAEAATEELLRFDPSVQISTKYATRDIPFEGETIREGDPITFVWGAINRDPAHFPEPHRLDFERVPNDHFSFGMGANYCLGASLARLEIACAVGALVARLPGLRLAAQTIEYKPQLHLHGLARLQIEWTTPAS